MHTLHLLSLDKDKPLQQLLYSHQIQLFNIAPVHQPLAFRFAQCVGSGPLSKIHQFVKAALFANGISHHKWAVSLAFRQIMFRREHHSPDTKTSRVAQVHLSFRIRDRLGVRRNSEHIVGADLSLHRKPDDEPKIHTIEQPGMHRGSRGESRCRWIALPFPLIV
jgi:hypothetical protein